MKDEYNQLYERTKEYKRSDYIREIQRLERLNKHLEKSRKELIQWLEDEVEDVKERIKKSEEYSLEGGYNLRMNLTYRKTALRDVIKLIGRLERDNV